MKDGKYHFDPSLLGEAHSQCLRDFIAGCLRQDPAILIDNTNTTTEEIAPYYAVANAYSYKVTLVTFKVDLEEASKRNTHGVPLKSIQAMDARINQRKLPHHWNINKELYHV